MTLANKMTTTKPKPRNVDAVRDKHMLVAGRYGTGEMGRVWGPEMTFLNVMQVQVLGLEAINEIKSGRLPEKYISALRRTANLTSENFAKPTFLTKQ